MVIGITLTLGYLIKAFFDFRARIKGNWIYFLVIYLRLKWIKWRTKRLLTYDYKASDMQANGAIPNPTEHLLDRPQKDKAEDVFMYGVNSNGTALSLSIKWRPETVDKKRSSNRGQNQHQQVSMVFNCMIRDKNGETYTLKERVDRHYDPSQDLDGHGYTEYRGGGLQLQIDSPLRRLRLKGRGYFKRSSDGQQVFLRLRFLWITTSCVLEYDYDQDPVFTAGELAGSLRSLKDLLRLIVFAPDGRSKYILAEERYEQMGQLKGILNVENEPQQELYLWGSKTKTRYADSNPSSTRTPKSIEFFAYTKTGTGVHVGATQHPTIKNLSYRYGGTFMGFGFMAPVLGSDITVNRLKQLSAQHAVPDQMMNGADKKNVNGTSIILNGNNNLINHNNNNNDDDLQQVDKCYQNGSTVKSSSKEAPDSRTSAPGLPTVLTVKDPMVEYAIEVKEPIDAKVNLFRVSIFGNEGCGLIVNHDEEDDDEDQVVDESEDESMIDGQVSKRLPTIGKTGLECLPNKKKWEIECQIPLVVSLTEPCGRLESITGGKGSSLALLRCLSATQELSSDTDSQFIVPYGVVVTTAAYKEMLRVNKCIATEVERLEADCNKLNQEELKKRCDAIVELISNAQLPIQVREAIGKTIGGQSAVKRYAVRSSACGEDSEEMSAAGQMETFLGIKGIEEVSKAIMKCWASSFGHIAVEYKRGYGQPINSPMAVVVQEMVDCDAAGVMFTCNPVTGDEREILITANYGLGESVVSASADPDTITLTVNVQDNDNGVKNPRSIEGIKEIKIGNKGTIVRMKGDEASGTDDVESDETQRSKACISEEDMQRLGKIGLLIQRFYASGPRDIEWGIKGDRIYMLQSRPITTLDSGLTEFEIQHEMDCGLPTEKEYLSRANVGEVLPGACSYLTSSFTFKAWDALCWDLMAKITGHRELPFQPYTTKQCALIKNYAFFNLKTCDFMRFEPDGSQSDFYKALTVSLFGHEIDDEELKRDCGSLKQAEGWQVRFRRWKFMFFHKTFMDHMFNQVEPVVKSRDWTLEMAKMKTSKEMLQYLFGVFNESVDAFNVHIIYTFVSSEYNNELLQALIASGGKGRDLYADFAVLLSTCKDVISAEVPRGIHKLAISVPEKDREAFHKMTWEEAYKYMTQTGPKAARDAFAAFMKIYGHRGYREFEPYALPWRDNPKPLIESIQTLTLSKGVTYADHNKLNPDELLDKLKTKIPFHRKLQLKYYILPRCWKAVGNRERTKNLIVFACDQYRRALWMIARKMNEEGLIPEADLFFSLAMEEVLHLIEHGRNPGLVRRAKQRRKVIHATMHWTFDEIIRGYEFYSQQERQSTIDMSQLYESQGDGSKLLKMRGTPVSSGKFKGTLCVCPTLNDAKNIKPGDILVTYSTDIGWSPYFPMLGGIVTEIGGLVSHGAVIAREYGLPALVGVDGAVRVFKTGDQVVLDCENGYIIKLENE